MTAPGRRPGQDVPTTSTQPCKGRIWRPHGNTLEEPGQHRSPPARHITIGRRTHQCAIHRRISAKTPYAPNRLETRLRNNATMRTPGHTNHANSDGKNMTARNGAPEANASETSRLTSSPLSANENVRQIATARRWQYTTHRTVAAPSCSEHETTFPKSPPGTSCCSVAHIASYRLHSPQKVRILDAMRATTPRRCGIAQQSCQ